MTEDDEKVLTPLGPFGRCYVYSETLNHRFVIAMTVIGWGTALLALAVLGLHLRGRIDPIQFFGWLIALLAIADATRVLSVRMLFRRAEPLKMGSGIPLGWTVFGQPSFLQTGILFGIYVEVVFIIGIIIGYAKSTEQIIQICGGIIFFHLGIYSLNFIRSLYYR